MELTLTTEQQALVDAGLARAAEERVLERVWAKDATLWGPEGTPELADRLGWLDIADRLHEELDDLEAFAQEVLADGITDVVLLGMGGSSLAPEVLKRSFGAREGFARLTVLDSTDADWVQATTDAIDVATTLFLVATKSGGTIETLSAFEHFHALQPDGAHFVAVTDPGSPLNAIAEEHGFRRVFENDPDIGGRYSALSYFGLVPAALTGADVRGLLDRAIEAAAGCRAPEEGEAQGLVLGVLLGELAKAGRDKLTFLICEPIASAGLWVEQLVAESTGKEGKGILPVADEPLGPIGEYGDDRLFVHLRNEEHPTEAHDAFLAEAIAAGHPVVVLEFDDDPAVLGALFLIAELATAIAGWALGINPFDQPNVAEAKAATGEVLKGYVADGALPTATDAGDDDLRALLADAGAPAYVAIMGYLHGGDEVDAAVSDLRAVIRARTGAATTFGYAPRFLHSTGQLHKGGPPTGRFLQLVTSAVDEVAIPNATYGFEVLKAAQAAGDLQTLGAHDLPAACVLLPGDPAAEIRSLTTRIKEL